MSNQNGLYSYIYIYIVLCHQELDFPAGSDPEEINFKIIVRVYKILFLLDTGYVYI